jgi:hypothetical protein
MLRTVNNMDRLEYYDQFKGTVLTSGLMPKNNNDFPLMEAHDVLAGESNLRLDEKLESIDKTLGGFTETGAIKIEDTVFGTSETTAPSQKAVNDALSSLINGKQPVAHATKADRDGYGRAISDTYLIKAFYEPTINRMINAFRYTPSYNSIAPGLYLPRVGLYLDEDRIDAYLPPIVYTSDRLPVMSEATVFGGPLRITVDGDGKVRYAYDSTGIATVSTVTLISLDTFVIGDEEEA